MPLPRINFLTEFRTEVFVETGTHRGDGVQQAVDAGFSCIYSIENNPIDYGYCLRRFEGLNTQVYLQLGSSPEVFQEVMRTVTTRCTIWLDAHWCDSEGGLQSNCPLLGELGVIRWHQQNVLRGTGIRPHIVLIDDVRLMGLQESFPTLSEVKQALLDIYPRYSFRLVPSASFPSDILIATP